MFIYNFECLVQSSFFQKYIDWLIDWYLLFKYFKILKSILWWISVTIRHRLCSYLPLFRTGMQLGIVIEEIISTLLLADHISVDGVSLKSTLDSLSKSFAFPKNLFKLLIFVWKIERPVERAFTIEDTRSD